MTVTEPTAETVEQPTDVDTSEDTPVEDDVLVEEISIDGMCGVY